MNNTRWSIINLVNTSLPYRNQLTNVICILIFLALLFILFLFYLPVTQYSKIVLRCFTTHFINIYILFSMLKKIIQFQRRVWNLLFRSSLFCSKLLSLERPVSSEHDWLLEKSELLFRSFTHKNERFARKNKERIPNPVRANCCCMLV